MSDPDLTSLHPDATRWRNITAGSGAMMRETYATAEQLGEALKVTEKTLDAIISDAENLRREVAELGRKATTDYLDLRGSIRTLGWVAAVELFLLVAVVCALVGVAAR